MIKFKKSTWIDWAIAIAIIGIMASIVMPSHGDYRPRARWAKAIASISELKLAVSECLLDNKENPQTCNSVKQLNKYGIKSVPILFDNVGKVELSAIANLYPVTILITGAEPLEGCQFAFIPTINAKGIITWNAVFINSTIASGTKCLTSIKSSKNLLQL